MGLFAFNKMRRRQAEIERRKAEIEAKRKAEEEAVLFICPVCAKEYKVESYFIKHLEKHREAGELVDQVSVDENSNDAIEVSNDESAEVNTDSEIDIPTDSKTEDKDADSGEQE